MINADEDSGRQLALDVFVRAVRHYLGAFLVELGGLDALTFSDRIARTAGDPCGHLPQW
jgi:acetate kinase